MADARDVVLEIPPNLLTAWLNAGRVELVLVNLLANAIKYSDPNKPRRLISARARLLRLASPASPSATTALGSPKSKLELIFDWFVRVHPHLDQRARRAWVGPWAVDCS